MLISHWGGCSLKMVSANSAYSNQRVASESVLYQVMAADFILIISLVSWSWTILEANLLEAALSEMENALLDVSVGTSAGLRQLLARLLLLGL